MLAVKIGQIDRMKRLAALALSGLFLVSCEKDQNVIESMCFKGRFVAAGCWPVIQLLEPFDAGLPTARYGSFENTFGTDSLPVKYKDGQPFYFTVKRIDSNKIYLTYCVPTKYFVEIESFSDSPCDENKE